MYDGKVCSQSFQYHIGSDVHLTYVLLLSVGTGLVLVRVVGVVEARYVPEHLARPATDSDEEKVVDAMRSKTGLVEVDRYVDETYVRHRQYDVAISISSRRQRLRETLSVQELSASEHTPSEQNVRQC